MNVIYFNEASKKLAAKKQREEQVGKALDATTIIACALAAFVAIMFVTTVL